MDGRNERKNTGAYIYENIVPDGGEKTTIAPDVLEALKQEEIKREETGHQKKATKRKIEETQHKKRDGEREENNAHVQDPEMDLESEKTIRDAAELLQNPRGLDNSSFRGRETSYQQNETLDLIEIAAKALESNKSTLKRLNESGIDHKKLSGKNIGKKGVGPLKGYEVISRTKDVATLVKGKSLYVYDLKLLALQPPATGQVGEKLDLSWPQFAKMATAKISMENERKREVTGNQLLREEKK